MSKPALMVKLDMGGPVGGVDRLAAEGGGCLTGASRGGKEGGMEERRGEAYVEEGGNRCAAVIGLLTAEWAEPGGGAGGTEGLEVAGGAGGCRGPDRPETQTNQVCMRVMLYGFESLTTEDLT